MNDMDALKNLATAAAELVVESRFSAHQIVIVELLRMLIERGSLTESELKAMLDRLDGLTSRYNIAAPSVCAALGDISLSIRNAFDPPSPKN